MARAALLCLGLSALSGCEDPRKPDLAVACALTQCTCTSNAAGYFERSFKEQTTTAVLWTERGNAYCPEGYSLKQVEKPKEQYYTP